MRSEGLGKFLYRADLFIFYIIQPYFTVVIAAVKVC
jgi:hypothetical protein